MISRTSTGLKTRTGIANYTRTPSDVTEFIVHYDGGETPTTKEREIELLRIYDRYHASKGWGGIGYNLAVGPVTGNVYEARGLNRVGAHTTGHNTSGIGVVVIGGNDALTENAKSGLKEAYVLANNWAGKTLNFYGHKDFANTSCPGISIYTWINSGGLTSGGDNMAGNYIIRQGVKVAPGTYSAYEKMRAGFKKATGYDLLITSGLRTYAEQKSLYDRWKAGTFHAPSVAPPGTSLHESGRALDLRDSGSTPGVTVAGNARSNWLRLNARKFGFSANGYSFGEPWHYEYQGNPWATTGGGSSSSSSSGSGTVSKYNPNGYNKTYVQHVQTRLIKHGYHLGNDGPDGILGSITFNQTKAFQKAKGLVADGIPGAKTLAELNKAPTKAKTSQIKAVQKAVRAVQDAIVGADTKKRVNAVRMSSRYFGSKFPYGVSYTQKVIGTTADNVWGKNSAAAHDRTVKAIQKAVGVNADGIWGRVTENAVKSLGI